MIIDWRSQHQHLRILQFFVYFLHIVLLNAGTLSFPMAVLTGKTAFDIHPADIETDDMMAVLFSRFTKHSNHFFGIAVWSGASIQYKDFHVLFSISFTSFSSAL